MRGLNLCATAAVLLVLSQGFLVKLTSGQAFPHHVFGPFSRFFWGFHYPGRQQQDNDQVSAMRRDAGMDDMPDQPHPHLEDFAEFYNSPEEAAAAAAAFDGRPEFLSTAWQESGDAQGLRQPEKPRGSQPPVRGDEKNVVVKRPLDSVGSGFMKKSQHAGDESWTKRSLDRLGTGLMKRPLDHLGQGLLKKRPFPQSDGDKKPFHTPSKYSLEDSFQGADPKRLQHADSKQSAVQLIKKGLDVLGTGLFKRGGEDSAGSAQIRTALDQLSKGVGNGDPSKGVDVDIVQRGLDQLGTGLLKRGLDTVGIGLIKRAVDNLHMGLRDHGASSKFLDIEGLELLRKGLDHLQTDLNKAGFDENGVRMFTRGAISLASWLVKQHSSDATTKYDKMAALSTKNDGDPASGLSKKSLDRLGTGLMKKRFESDDLIKGKEPFDKELRKKKKYEQFIANNKQKYTDFRAFQENKYAPDFKAGKGNDYADLKAAFHRDHPEEKSAQRASDVFSKNIKPESEEKGSYDVPMPPRKKGLDKIGTGFIKKGLDEVGSGFIKKGLDEVGSGFIKKGLDEVGSGFIKKGLDEVGSGFIKKGLDEVGSGFIKKGLDEVGSGFIKKGLDEVGSGFIKKGLDEVGSGFIKKGLDEVGSGFIKKGLDEVGSGFIKKGLDEVGSGFIKKDLDYVGSGLMKKDAWAPVPKELQHPDAGFHQQQPPWLRPPSMEKNDRPQNPHSDDKPQQIPKTKYGQKTAELHGKKSSSKLASKSY